MTAVQDTFRPYYDTVRYDLPSNVVHQHPQNQNFAHQPNMNAPQSNVYTRQDSNPYVFLSMLSINPSKLKASQQQLLLKHTHIKCQLKLLKLLKHPLFRLMVCHTISQSPCQTVFLAIPHVVALPVLFVTFEILPLFCTTLGQRPRHEKPSKLKHKI